MTQRQHTVLAVLLVVLGALVVRLTTVEIQSGAEGAIASRAERIVHDGSWMSSVAGIPPLSTWAAAFGVAVVGKSVVAVRWLSLLFTIVLCFATYVLARRYLTYSNAMIAMVVTAASLPIAVYGRIASDVIPFAAVATSYLAVLLSLREDGVTTSYWKVLAIAVMITASALLLPAMSLVLVVASLPYVFAMRHRKPIGVGIVLGAFAATAWYLAQFLRYGSVPNDPLIHTAGFATDQDGMLHITSQLALAGPFTLAAAAWCIVELMLGKQRAMLTTSIGLVRVLFGVFLFVLLAVGILGHVSTPYWALVVPLGAIVTVDAVGKCHERRHFGLLTSLYGCIGVASLWSVLDVVHANSGESPISSDVTLLFLLGVALAAGVMGARMKGIRALAIRVHRPIVFGSIGVAVLLSMYAIVLQSHGYSRGAREVATLLSQDTVAVKSFVLVHHIPKSVDREAIDPALAWYTHGWMYGWNKRYTYSAFSFERFMAVQEQLDASSVVSWVVHAHGRVHSAERRALAAELGTTFETVLSGPDYTLYRNR